MNHSDATIGEVARRIGVTEPTLRYYEELGLFTPARDTGGAATHCMAVHLDDVDAHFAKVSAAGAGIVYGPADMPYGVRECGVRDLEGFLWWSFMQPHQEDESGQ